MSAENTVVYLCVLFNFYIFMSSCSSIIFWKKKTYLLFCFFSFVYLNHDAVTYILISPSSTQTGNLGIDEIKLIELYAHRYCFNISQ